ncbi:MAG TPA: methyltransferase domain-containing protein [Anaerolineales bacterium]|nr:methyltransferase domain-containing protein [Anaerolineales bacterium]
MSPNNSPKAFLATDDTLPGSHNASACPFDFACPGCHSPLQSMAPDELTCPEDGQVYPKIDGIWRLLRPGRSVDFEQFIREYEIVRSQEGRGSQDREYYRALPFADLSGRLARDWKIRARSYQALIDQLLEPLELLWDRPMKILDVGAGNCWLSNRLSQRGHLVASVDLLTNSSDGLGCHIFYPTRFTPVQAEFDCLPFREVQADLVVFNASFHYSTRYETTLREAQRVLRPDGQLVILDTPIYHGANSGRQMVREREQQFSERYGFPSNALPSENYLTHDRLKELGESVGIEWQIAVPNYGLGWTLDRLKARLRARREPAAFLLLIGRFASEL